MPAPAAAARDASRDRSETKHGSETSLDEVTYRLQHPIRYSAAAAILAGVISFPLDLFLFGHPLVHAWKVAISSSATWFGVLLVMSFSQRVKVRDRL